MVARISRTAAMVMSGWRKAKRATVSPSQVGGGTTPALAQWLAGPSGTNWTPVALLFLGMAVVSVVCVLLHRAPEESEGAELTATPTLMEA
ncbi:hypothetical protein ACFY20_19670 [Streptomyces sp. NPDC001312]|uniref:hypothetical protein n=1 Tax=Streptomyces sp. NPDC001312 TaxID=3364561 RepID=UPI0036CB5315